MRSRLHVGAHSLPPWTSSKLVCFSLSFPCCPVQERPPELLPHPHVQASPHQSTEKDDCSSCGPELRAFTRPGLGAKRLGRVSLPQVGESAARSPLPASSLHVRLELQANARGIMWRPGTRQDVRIWIQTWGRLTPRLHRSAARGCRVQLRTQVIL